jgi:hypothetical protein
MKRWTYMNNPISDFIANHTVAAVIVVPLVFPTLFIKLCLACAAPLALLAH